MGNTWPTGSPTKKLGIALGSGAAKGLAHIGVLKALQKAGIVADMIAGTSIGALIGALYCIHGDILAVEKLALEYEDVGLHRYLFPRPSLSGFISQERIRRFLIGLLGEQKIEDLARPFFCTATDINSGAEVVFSEGSLVEAVLASVSIPVIFPPCFYRNRHLSDGGLVNPVPVDVLVRNRADRVIAVNVIPAPASTRSRGRKVRLFKGSQPLLDKLGAFFSESRSRPGKNAGPNLGEIILSTIEIMQQQLVQSRLQVDSPDIIIQVDTTGITLFQFNKPAQIIRRGEEAVGPQLGLIRQRLDLPAGG